MITVAKRPVFKESSMWTPTLKNIEHIVKQPDKLLTVAEDVTAAAAAKKMSDNHVGCLLVLGGRDKFVGVLSERDLLAKVLTKSLSPDAVRVKDIMTENPISCTLDTTVPKVEQLMAENGIRHIPIIENGRLIGVISSRDVIAYRMHNNRILKTAAEQMALLSTGLKSLDFEDVVTLTTNQVPKSFQADRAVLSLASKDKATHITYRNRCTVPERILLQSTAARQTAHSGKIICGRICHHCEKLGGRLPRLLIPLGLSESTEERGRKSTSGPSFLCMCGLDNSPERQRELHLYKASILQRVLSINLANARLYQKYQQARWQSRTDPLTKVASRWVLDDVLQKEYERAVQYNRTFSIAIIDVDNFKQINDQAGHEAGDKTLRQLAGVMRRVVRKTDVIIRYGGDEFLLLLPETTVVESMMLLERLRRRVKTISISGVSITISCGLAQWSGTAEQTPEKVLKSADTALYEAKSKGRDRVVACRNTHREYGAASSFLLSPTETAEKA